MYSDPAGYIKTYIIYYNNPGSDFATQAKNRIGVGSNVVYKPVVSIKDFKDAWKNISGADVVYLYLHGGTGVLYFKGETMSISQINGLASKSIKKVFLFSCYGGAGSEGKNVAWAIAKRANATVIACTGSVSYIKYFGYTYARVSSISTCWNSYYYSSGKAKKSFYAWVMV